jgi:hypothetical protein
MPLTSSKQALLNSSVVLWMLEHKFKTSGGHPFEFVNHRWALDYLADDHPHKASIKAAQLGLTEMEMIDDFHLVGKRGMNVAHTLHTSDILQSFVRPKVNPLIMANPEIAKMLTTDSEGLKGFNKNFLFIKGANAESQAISFTADVLKVDEKDRSNLSVVEMFESRMAASKFRWIREFSNPSSVGTGVDAAWGRSNQFHWFVQCSHCRYRSYIDFDKGDLNNHFVDQVKRIFACGKCGGELTNADRIRGEWIAKWPSRDKVHGYWFSWLMASWFSAEDIIHEYETKSVEYFHNMVLGVAYTQADLRFDRDTIQRACRPQVPVLQHVVMGSDIGKPHWYWLATPMGFFKYGQAKDWDELERIFLEYNCEAWVMDALPEFTQVQKYITKYRGRAFACYFVPDSKAVGAIRWQEGDKRGLVYADRTKAIDRVVTEFSQGQNSFLTKTSDMDDMIKHAGNMYRVVETDEKGKTVVEWRTVTKPDHLMFALVYTRIALERVFSGSGAGVIETHSYTPAIEQASTVSNGKIGFKVDVASSLAKSQTRR